MVMAATAPVTAESEFGGIVKAEDEFAKAGVKTAKAHDGVDDAAVHYDVCDSLRKMDASRLSPPGFTGPCPPVPQKPRHVESSPTAALDSDLDPFHDFLMSGEFIPKVRSVNSDRSLSMRGGSSYVVGSNHSGASFITDLSDKSIMASVMDRIGALEANETTSPTSQGVHPNKSWGLDSAATLRRSSWGSSISSRLFPSDWRRLFQRKAVQAPQDGEKAASRAPRFATSFLTALMASFMFLVLVSCGSLVLLLEVVMESTQTGPLQSRRDLIGELTPDCSSTDCSDLDARVQAQDEEMQELVIWARTSSIAIFAITLALGVVFSHCLALSVARPARSVSTLIKKFGETDMVDELEELVMIRAGQVSRFTDIREFQAAISRLTYVIEVFARYVPQTLVRSIVRGDERATRLHVSKREVTIMFSDIADFTTISESLTQEKTLFMLTRYLSIMTRIVEEYSGVVAEILGDGLLVFWNTPDDVEDHAALACVAALSQQRAIQKLNVEFQGMGLPQIGIRIGINTGKVLTGILGSETKMKFGCMGDPINLASRLEGLCKSYGVNILCSASTHDRLPACFGLLCRKLDLVQVKGKRQPTLIYELLGITESDTSDAPPIVHKFSSRSVSFCADLAMQSSKAAMDKSMSDEKKGTLWNGLLRSLGRGWDERVPPAGIVTQTPAIPQSSSVSSMTSAGTVKDVRLTSMVTPELRRFSQKYEEALNAFQQARFVDARSIVTAVLAERPWDKAALILLERVHQCIGPDGTEVIGLTADDLKNWTGVRVMTEK